MRIIFPLSIFFVIILGSCRKPEYIYIEGLAQGTSYHVVYEGTELYSSDIEATLKAIDLSLSAWNPNSVLSRINRNDSTVFVDKFFSDVFLKAKDVNEKSDGMFDITVGPLIKAWGFYDTIHNKHDTLTISNLLRFVGMKKIKLVDGKVIKDNKEICIDVNAIAQGYSVDVVSQLLEKHHIKNYLIEIGGEVKAHGKNSEGSDWKIGIDKPIFGNQLPGTNLQVIVKINHKALATSGDYRRYVVVNGIKLSHHVNPKTGYPSDNNLLSVSILADDCITADAYGTACMVLGLEKSKMLLKKTGLEGYLIYNDNNGDYKVFTTDGFAKILK